MKATRSTKNIVLCAANFALLFVVAPKFALNPDDLSDGMKVWMFGSPIVIAAVMLTPATFQYVKAIHALLFLATGAAIGLTLGSLIRVPDSVTVGEILWLPVGIGAAVFHYWPSVNDKYQ